jgi:CRP-like cAMP-binding protein
MISEAEVAKVADGCALLAPLTEVERRAVVENGRWRQLDVGEFFFHQGEPAELMYLIARGRVKLTQLTPDGTQVILNYFGPGEGLGIIIALSNMAYPLSAEVVEVCTCIYWDKETMRRLMLQYPQLALNGLDMVARRFAQLQERYQELSTQRVEQRIARTLLRLVTQFGKQVENGILVDMALTREDLAQMTGTNLYNVSRILSKWEQQGFVYTERKYIVLQQPHQIVLIAEDLPSVKSALP